MTRIGRRGFLRALLGLAAALLAPARRFAARAEAPPLPARARLAGFAAVIVPAWNGHPAAGGADFLARFEALAEASAERSRAYRGHFERFVAEVDGRVPPRDPPDADALAALFESWHEEWRREARPSFGAQFFEFLRRDVLRVHYGSADGWKAVGWAGPAHRASPDA